MNCIKARGLHMKTWDS